MTTRLKRLYSFVLAHRALQYGLFFLVACFFTYEFLEMGPNLDDSKLLLSPQEIEELSWFHDFYEVFPIEFNDFYRPWYAVENYKIVFFRPLSSLSIVLTLKLGLESLWELHLVNILLYFYLIYLYMKLLEALGFSRSMCFLGTVVFLVDFKNLEVVSWATARNPLLMLLFSMLSLIHLLRALSLPADRKNLLLSLLFFGLCLLSYETGFSAVFFLLPVACFLPSRSRRWYLAALVAIAVSYLLYYFTQGYGARSGVYLDPVNNFAGYLQRVRDFYPSFIFKKFSTNSDISFYPFEPAWAFWLFTMAVLGWGLLLAKGFSKAGVTKQVQLTFLLTSFLHPLLLSASVVSGRSVILMSLSLNLLFVLTTEAVWRQRPRWVTTACALLLAGYLAMNFYLSHRYVENDDFYNYNQLCSKNLASVDAYFSGLPIGRKVLMLNEPPLLYHRLIPQEKKAGRVSLPFTDNALETLEVSALSKDRLAIRSDHPLGLVQHVQPYLYGDKFFRDQEVRTPENLVKITQVLPTGMPSAIEVFLPQNLDQYDTILWRPDCTTEILSFQKVE